MVIDGLFFVVGVWWLVVGGQSLVGWGCLLVVVGAWWLFVHGGVFILVGWCWLVVVGWWLVVCGEWLMGLRFCVGG